jgi:hypothetical protein
MYRWTMTTPPLELVAGWGQVQQFTNAARTDIDEVLWRRDIRAASTQVAKSSIARGGADSAALEGADLVGVEQSPMGKVLAASLAATVEAPKFNDIWMRAPLQVITGLHTLVAKEFLPREQLARPRLDQSADDPLHIGGLPEHTEVPSALMRLSQQCSATKIPAVIEAGYVHGEIMRLRPFTWGSGLVARAAVRTVLSARSLDPSNFTIPENGMFESTRTAYVNAIRDFATGTQEGIESYFAWFSASLGLGARAVVLE